MKIYQPTNGTEGMCFQEHYCERCRKDDIENKILCDIIARACSFDVTDKEYPKEWVCDDDGSNPRCTAFDDEAIPLPPPVDTETLPLFGDE